MPGYSFLLVLSGIQLIHAQDAKQVASSATPEITMLVPGPPIGREISGGQTHVYQITLTKDQFAGVTIEQRGVDVTEQLFAPDGKLIAKFNSEVKPEATERSDFVADAPGVYRLAITTRVKNRSGHYAIRMTEPRSATDEDRMLDEAHRLSTRASILDVDGKYDEAHALASKALDAGEKALGRDHQYVAYLLGELGFIQRRKGEYAKAEALLQRALAINQKALGPEHPQTVDSMNKLGRIYRSMNDFAKAKQLLSQTVEITEKTLGAEDPIVVEYLLAMDALHHDLGDLVQAERAMQRALTIGEKSLDPASLEMAAILNNLGDIARSKKDYVRAEPLLQRALANYEKQLGPSHPRVADTLQNLGIMARERGEYERAIELYERALAIREKALGPEHLNVAALLNNIGNIYKVKGDYGHALEMYQRALSIGEKSGGPYHGLTLMPLSNIARAYAAQGDIANAIKFQTRVDTASDVALALDFAIGSEREKLAYVGSLNEKTDRTISMHVNLAPSDRTAAVMATLVILQRKGRVLDAMSAGLAALRQRADPEDQKLLDQLKSTTEQLAKLALDGPQNTSAAEYHRQLTSLEEQKEDLEEKISVRSAEFRAQSQPVTLAAVQAAIPPNTALIEFAIYRPFDPRAEKNSDAFGKPRYVAYVIPRQGDVQWKDLGDSQAIEASVQALRLALRDPARNEMRSLARGVDEKLMEPIRPLLGEARHLLISPDGELNLIPFEALVDEKGQYLISRYSFTYLTSGRDLLRMQSALADKRKSKVTANPLVVANPSFGEPVSEEIASTTARPVTPGRLRSVTSASSLSEVYFAPLGATEQEALTIKNFFPDASLLTAERATESALKQTAAPRILHIATHGFFLSETSASAGGNRGAVRNRPGGGAQNPL
jgi:tetratricopeptide (TPR) repeat protein